MPSKGRAIERIRLTRCLFPMPGMWLVVHGRKDGPRDRRKP